MIPETLAPAIERRVEQLNAEYAEHMRQTSPSKTLTELLGRSIALTLACAGQLKPSAMEFAATEAFFSEQQNNIINQLQDEIDKAKTLHERLARFEHIRYRAPP